MSGGLDPRVAALAAVVLFSHTVQAMTGFGSTVIALTLGALFFPIEELRLVLVGLNLPLCLWVVLRQPEAIDRRLLSRAILPWMGVGLVLGLLASGVLQGTALRRVFGALVGLFAVRELWALARGRPLRPAPPQRVPAWLLAAGVVHGVSASGGPLLVTALGGVQLDRRAFRATLMAVWLVLSVALLGTALAQGQWTRAMSADVLLLLPTLPLGALAGEWLHHRAPDGAFRGVIQAVLLLAGAALLR